MDGSFDVETGLRIARKLCLDLAELGLPLATEALDPMTPQYLADLFSWSAIGARTTESQTHRELASGLSMAVGFKNGTDGDLAVALNAMQSSAQSHSFIGINQQGKLLYSKQKVMQTDILFYVAVKPQIMKSNMLMIVNGC
ncbi:Phospho-2-dehydro-3-deoxyheptonate aldolase, Tyr-sensitive [Mannheimia haemolytica]|uniref:3-deoxy-7-phosphoheptulonate synthase n=1 Tax=Mannheimia haemolytica TaxID=75985 RepID=A0A378N8A1_MANHA|nr:Phospho-2-dehydro-3-deoxyheptonate aldolase, Tyr-sensitive [Mannheimia haemolytica]